MKNTTRVSGVFRTRLTYAAPASEKILTGETRMIATSVPMTRDPTAEASVSWMVIQKAPRTSYSAMMSSTEDLSEGWAGSGDGGSRRPPPIGYEQASCFGGLSLDGTKPDGPTVLSIAVFQAPLLTILAMAVFTFVQSSVSPFLRPTP